MNKNYYDILGITENEKKLKCQGKQHFINDTFFDKRKEKIKDRDKRKFDLCKGRIKLYYYSNFKIDNYLDTVYNDKNELLEKIITNKDGKGLL